MRHARTELWTCKPTPYIRCTICISMLPMYYIRDIRGMSNFLQWYFWVFANFPLLHYAIRYLWFYTLAEFLRGMTSRRKSEKSDKNLLLWRIWKTFGYFNEVYSQEQVFIMNRSMSGKYCLWLIRGFRNRRFVSYISKVSGFLYTLQNSMKELGRSMVD